MNFPQHPFIDGKTCVPREGQRTELINPANEEPVTAIFSAGLSEVDAAVAGAQGAFDGGWRDLSPGKRTEILFAVAARLRDHAGEIASLESRNIGKPIADAQDEAALGARVFEYYAGAVSKFFGETIPVARGGFNFTLRQPMGVVAAIVPWNFPFPIACWKVAPALAAGNCVVLKPASLSPLTAMRLGELAHEAGLPAGVLQVLPGSGGEIGNALAQHPLVRKISFTGSTEVGSHLMQLAGRGIKRVSLELGGKSPNIVFADADVEKAASASPMSVFANTGQDCCARSRVFVERPVFDRFVEKFLGTTRGLTVGDPSRAETQIGPLVSAQQRAAVEGFLATAKNREIIGGDRIAGRGYYLRPAIVLGCEPGDKVWREEVFGPVVCIRPFDDEATMLREVNDSPYGLSGSLWTNDLKRALRVARRVESGVLSINSHSSVHVEAPFGGFKQSGLGRDLGMNALEGYTELKNIYISEDSIAMNLKQLSDKIKVGEIDTVIVAFPDVFGRLIGKRFTGDFFLKSVAKHGTHGCNYLLTVNIEMDPMDGFQLANWEKGFGDFEWRPDFSTLRLIPWQTASALILCNLHHHDGSVVSEAPRSVLQKQVERLSTEKLICNTASELEFFLFNTSYSDAFAADYRNLPASSDYRIDYHTMQPARDEEIFRSVRNQMCVAGVAVESSKGEWGRGQHEINFAYAQPQPMADMHVVFKQGVKEIFAQHGRAVSFMPKYSMDEPGNSCHIHASIWRGGRNLFWDAKRECGSKFFRQFLGGLIKYSRELSYFFAPTINAYKRFQAASWAPTKLAWSTDNRTTGFRVVGHGNSLRIENRMPGGDANPYLAFAATIIAGMAGVEEQLDCGDPYEGNAYVDTNLLALPRSLREATDLLEGSELARKSFGSAVVDFYLHTARLETDAFDNAVTDWEKRRYFERI